MPGTKLQEHTGSEKAWVWSAVDFADEVQSPELFCIRFASVESTPQLSPRKHTDISNLIGLFLPSIQNSTSACNSRRYQLNLIELPIPS